MLAFRVYSYGGDASVTFTSPVKVNLVAASKAEPEEASAAAAAVTTAGQRVFLGKSSSQHFKGSVGGALLEGELIVLDVHDWDSRVGIVVVVVASLP